MSTFEPERDRLPCSVAVMTTPTADSQRSNPMDEAAGTGATPPDPAGSSASRRDVGRNMKPFAIAQVSVRLLGLVVVVAVARLLSKDDFGRYTVAMALSAMVTLPVESGMGGYVVREGTQAPDGLGVVLGHVMTLQVLLGLAAVGISAAVGVLLGYDPETLTTTLLLTLAAVVMIVTRSQMAVLVSLKRARPYAAYTSGQAFVLALLTLVAAFAGWGPVGIGAATLATAALSFPAGQVLLRRHWTLRMRFRREGLKRTFTVSAAYAASKLGTAVLTYIDAVMLQAISGNAAAAQYGAAYRLSLAVRLAPLIYADSLSQPMARLAQKTDRSELADLFNRAAFQLFALAVPVSLGGLLLAEPLMTTIFGDRYADSALVAGLLLLTLVVQFPRQAVIQSALAAGLERRLALGYLVTIVVNVSANALLIPAYGPLGAAIAMIISVPVLSGFMARQLGKVGIPLHVDARWAKVVVAGIAMSAVVYLADDLPLVVPIALGAAVYCAALVLLGALDEGDLEMLPGRRYLRWLVRSSSRG